MRIITSVLITMLASCGSAKPTATSTPGDTGAGTRTYDYSEDSVKAAEAKDEPAPPPAAAPPAGGLNKSSIRHSVRASLSKLAACADKATASVTVTMKFVIDAKGMVTSSTASGGDDATNACVAEVVKGMTFDPPGSVTAVTYPLKIEK